MSRCSLIVRSERMLHKIYLVLAAVTRMIGIAVTLWGAIVSLTTIAMGEQPLTGFVPLVAGVMIVFSAKTIARFAVAGLE
jgi:hypothetical protein